MKIENMPLRVVLTLVRESLMTACGTTRVQVLNVGFDYDYCEDELVECAIVANVEIESESCDNGTHPWVLVWNEEDCDFNTIMRLDQK